MACDAPHALAPPASAARAWPGISARESTMVSRHLLEALLACTAASASRYADKASQGEPSGCLADDADACGAAVACARFAPWSAPHFGCLRRELLLDSGEPRPGARYVVMQQAGFGMANSIRGSVNGGVLIAAATNRKLALDWPDLERNFAAAPPLRLAFDRAPEPGEWWLDARNTTFWTETAVGKVEGVEDVYLERLRGPSSPTFAISSSGGTSLPGSDATRACAARLFGAACAARRACLAGALSRLVLDAPSPRLARAVAAVDDASGPADVVVGLHLRSWTPSVEGEEHPSRPPLDAWGAGFFDCAARALEAVRGASPGAAIRIYLATDERAFRENATARLGAYGAVAYADPAMQVTHTRQWHKRGSTMRTESGGDTAVLDFYYPGAKAHVFVGTRASTFSDGIIERGCLNNLETYWQYDSKMACKRSACDPFPG